MFQMFEIEIQTLCVLIPRSVYLLIELVISYRMEKNVSIIAVQTSALLYAFFRTYYST